MQKILIKAKNAEQAILTCQKFLSSNAIEAWAYQAEKARPDALKPLLADQYAYLNTIEKLGDIPAKDIPFELLVHYIGTRIGEYMESLPFYNLIEKSYWVYSPLKQNYFLVDVRITPAFLN